LQFKKRPDFTLFVIQKKEAEFLLLLLSVF